MDKGKEKCEILKAIRAYVVEKYGYIVVSGRISVRKEGTIKSIKSKLKIPKYFEGIDRLTIILLNK